MRQAGHDWGEMAVAYKQQVLTNPAHKYDNQDALAEAYAIAGAVLAAAKPLLAASPDIPLNSLGAGSAAEGLAAAQPTSLKEWA